MILPAPMLLHERRHLPFFDQPGWLYELKFDGYRLIAGVRDGEVRLATKRGADATRWFPEVVQGLAQLKGGPHVMDGEVCVLDELGRSVASIVRKALTSMAAMSRGCRRL